MTVSSTINRKEYTGDAATTSFSFPYPVLASGDLKVYQNGTLKTITTHYTLSGTAPYTAGTNVQFVTAPATDDEIVILRDPAITQSTDLVENDALPSGELEKGYDRLTMISQRLADRLDRALRLPDTEQSIVDPVLPALASRKGYMAAWDGTTGAMEVSDFTHTQVASAVAAAYLGGLATTLDAVAFVQAGVGMASRSTQDKIREYWVSANDAEDMDSTGVTDSTAALQAALTTGKHVFVPPGTTIKISDFLTLASDQIVWVAAGARINQITADKGVFRATSKSNVTVIVDGILHGPGVWSAAWVGNSGHLERGVFFEGVTNGKVLGHGTIRNFGHAQVAVLGGSAKIIGPRLEGTHTHGQVIALNDNFQSGVYCADQAVGAGTYGLIDDIEVNCDISGTAQGILREHVDTGTTNAGPMKIRGFIHDITGQHATYIQRGNLDLNIRVQNIALSAAKISAAASTYINANARMRVVGDVIGSHVFEIQTLGVGSENNNLGLECECDDVGGALLSLLGPANRVRANLVGNNATYGVLGQNNSDAQGLQKDIQVRINGKDFDWSGVYLLATNSDYKIWPTLRECNVLATATHCGVLVASASATVDLFDADITDASTKMQYAVFNSVSGSLVRINGKAVLSGGLVKDVRATGLIEWNTGALLDQSRLTGSANTYSDTNPMTVKAQSTSASNVILWSRTLDDESAYSVRAQIVGKLSDSAQRKEISTEVCVYRDGGGGATIQNSGATALVTVVPVTFNPASVAANTSVEQTMTVSGVAVGDTVIVTKPTLSAGLSIGGARVSAADTVEVVFVNSTAAPIDAGSESYSVTVIKPAGLASSSFAGVYSWAVSGNEIRLLVNSGGAATYDWKATVNTVEMS